MNSHFPRIITLLRKERGLSQKKAAEALQISQALLSHYEKGIRECGLDFVVRAADFYGVSCDYLLGRSMARDGSAVPAGRMDVQESAELEKSHVVQAVSLLLDLAQQTGSMQLPREIEDYLSVVLYKVYRYMYMADPAGVEAVFRASREQFEYLCDARLKEHELRIRTAAKGEEGFGLIREELHRFPMSPNEISKRYPALSGALLTILQQVSDSINALGNDGKIKFQKK